jgi:YegS/Rv2252/BmrU family lipid kinase
MRFTEHSTRKPDEAAQVTRAAIRDGVRLVIAVGGDGTLNEVVNGYLDAQGKAINPDAAIGLLPSGTGSDFRRSVGLTSWRDALFSIARPVTRKIDAIRVDFSADDGSPRCRFCINIVSFGLGADAVALVNRWRERLPRMVGGRARFIIAAVRALKRYRNIPVKITLDDNREIAASTNLIVVANGRFAGGGMMLAPNAVMDDGLLDVIVADRVSRLEIIRELPRIGRGGHLKNPLVGEYRARSISVNAEGSLGLEIDGESAGKAPARLCVLPASVRLLVKASQDR